MWPQGHRLGKKGQSEEVVHELNFGRTFKVEMFKIKIQGRTDTRARGIKLRVISHEAV